MDIVDEAKDLIVFIEKNGCPANTNYVLGKLVKEILSLRQQLEQPIQDKRDAEYSEVGCVEFKDWQHLAYARLGVMRNSMTDDEVKTVQRFLGYPVSSCRLRCHST